MLPTYVLKHFLNLWPGHLLIQSEMQSDDGDNLNDEEVGDDEYEDDEMAFSRFTGKMLQQTKISIYTYHSE